MDEDKLRREIARHLGLQGACATKFWGDFHVVMATGGADCWRVLDQCMEGADCAAGARVPLVGVWSGRRILVVLEAADLAEVARLVMLAIARL